MKYICKICKKPIKYYRVEYNIEKQGIDITIICHKKIFTYFFQDYFDLKTILMHLGQDWEIEL